MAKRYAKLIYIDGVNANSNKVYEMIIDESGTFTAHWGRVGETLNKTVYPASKFDSKLREKTRKGYVDVTELHIKEEEDSVVITNNKGFYIKASRSEEVKKFVELLQSMAKQSIDTNYTVKAEQVTKKQVDKAQDLMNDFTLVEIEKIISKAEVDSLNKKLVEFYGVIPRKMRNVKDHLVSETWDKKQKEKFWSNLLDDEQKTLDVMSSQVSLLEKQKEDARKAAEESTKEFVEEKDILDSMELEMEEVTDASTIQMIKSKMQSKANMFVKAFKVKNSKTKKAYDEYVSKADNKYEELLWHGSRSENWWSIYEKGLIAKFPGAINCGSMLGAGVYFATEFDKSLGYTSISGSRWSGGSKNIAYLALFKVHLGKQYVTQTADSSLNANKMDKMGYDSTWGKKGVSLMRDEFVTYKTPQSTIEYIIEVKGSQY